LRDQHRLTALLTSESYRLTTSPTSKFLPPCCPKYSARRRAHNPTRYDSTERHLPDGHQLKGTLVKHLHWGNPPRTIDLKRSESGSRRVRTGPASRGRRESALVHAASYASAMSCKLSDRSAADSDSALCTRPSSRTTQTESPGRSSDESPRRSLAVILDRSFGFARFSSLFVTFAGRRPLPPSAAARRAAAASRLKRTSTLWTSGFRPPPIGRFFSVITTLLSTSLCRPTTLKSAL